MKNFLSLTIAEQRSLLFLFILISSLTIWRYWPVPEQIIEIKTVSPKQIADSAENKIESEIRSTTTVDIQPKWNLKPFDINYAKAKQLRLMGFSNDFISAWFSRKNEIGFVTSVDQLRATGLLSENEFATVAPYLDFSRYKKEVTKPIRKPLIVYINQADAEDFKQLKGIGEVLSKRIVAYREKLGGFTQINQLSEVYGLHDSVLLQAEDQLKLVDDHQTINLNSADAKMLYSHPYIDYKRAKAIVRYRDQHGPFQHLEDVLEIVLIDSAWLRHTRSYLSL